MGIVRPSEREWLLSNVTETGAGCWEWTRGRHSTGYGVTHIHGRRWYCHRLAWFVFNGEPGGLHVCHRCDNPPCCNPDHLFLGTHRDNHRDKAAKGRTGKEKRSGELNNRSKLTDEKVRNILSSTASGGALARELGVSRTLVNMVRRREIWRHI